MKLIAALSLNNCIGNKGKVPFKVKEDLKRFKELTTDNVVIMGARTFFEDLEGKPLSNRTNIVVTSKTHTLQYEYTEKAFIVNSPEFAYDLAKELGDSVWLIGGASLYSYYLQRDMLDEMYITHVHKVIDGDTYFNVRWVDWLVEEEEYHEDFSFIKYKRNVEEN